MPRLTMFFASVLAFIVVYLSTVTYASIGPVSDLHIVNAMVEPDGYPRQGVLAEGIFPGPLIQGQKGDNFKINVINQLTNATMKKSTSIHWHGIAQHGTNWADGPAFVTQCPIASGNSFLYDFKVPEQAGTFWYHSHLSTQYCDGLRGPLVVYDPHDPFAHLYDVDNENTIVTLADWYHTAAVNVQVPEQSDATLINGLGRFSGGPASPLSVFTVQRGKRYRFRLISLACVPNYNFTIDGHNMTVIEADGVNHIPVTVDQIQIFASQRYSFILTASQTVDNYWIRAAPNDQSMLMGFDGGINSAILRYTGAPDQEPRIQQTRSVKPLLETDLHPLVNAAAPGNPWEGGADMVLPLNLTNNITRFFVNGATFAPPSAPVLLQILSGAKTAQELLPPGSVYSLPRNKVIELVIPPGNAPGGPHPFHLHGHSFSVVRSAGSSQYNYINPARRDTVSIGTDPNDRVTVRFTTDNPGPWLLHCHIVFHLEVGLAIVLAEDIPGTKFANPVPAEWADLCPKYDSLDPDDL